MWSELETLVRVNSTTSPAHEKVLQCILDCRKPPGDETVKISTKRAADRVTAKVEKTDPEAMETQAVWPESDRQEQNLEFKKNVLINFCLGGGWGWVGWGWVGLGWVGLGWVGLGWECGI